MPADPSIVDIGIGAAVALLIIKEVLSFARDVLNKKNGGNGHGVPPAMAAGIKELTRDYWEPVLRMTDEMHKWHNVHDNDGVKMWYVRPSLVVAIRSLSDNIDTQTNVLQEIIKLQKEMISDLKAK